MTDAFLTHATQSCSLVAILVRLWSTWSKPYTDVLHNSSHTGSGIIVYGLSLKLWILRLIEVVHRWFSKRKHILRRLTGWCAIFSWNIPASCDRAYRSARQLRNGRGYKPCLSTIYNVIDKQRLRIRLAVLHVRLLSGIHSAHAFKLGHLF